MLQFFGQFHPAVVHFPIALLLVAAMAEALSLITGHKSLHAFASFSLHLGAAGAVAGAALGWALAVGTDVPVEMRPTLYWHRWLGTATAVFAVLSQLAWMRFRMTQSPAAGWIYRLALLAASVTVGIVGHLGGLLIYGLDYYKWTFN